MPLIETGKPAPHHNFTDPDEARKALSAAIEFLIEVDGYSPDQVRDYVAGEAHAYEEVD